MFVLVHHLSYFAGPRFFTREMSEHVTQIAPDFLKEPVVSLHKPSTLLLWSTNKVMRSCINPALHSGVKVLKNFIRMLIYLGLKST